MAGSKQSPAAAGLIRVEVIRAERLLFRSVRLDLASGATVGEAARESGLLDADGFNEPVVGHAVFGERATADRQLADGDRVELLSVLIADPKQARRRRAGMLPPVDQKT